MQLRRLLLQPLRAAAPLRLAGRNFAPPLRALPMVSCVLTRDLPMPPPPQPPMMPPSPPPGYAIDVSQCYLGGHAHFVVAPHKVSSTAALQT